MRQVDPVRQRRFIPAGAGNTDEIVNKIIGAPVYPRWRGEHTTGAIAQHRAAGLSPLARGTRQTRKARIWI
ncbi:hypothetical protein SEEH9341_19331 [Salmonella enterica subsp. enterica serovar Heidelberg str. N29341]|nr:hypothetical protein CFSAN00326_13073 [Salmonella enterica subsp. enterica serovar Heidelberg str. CFSAN00326]EYE81940.1 hypothetical protein SEEH1514_10605 [Salmonella enterica subsp. enterica serovar Heidelberg str. N1514]EYI04584.1 hypothetical protein SEEH9871_22973 [Salmonella enterica subsp. enterica serovar Heidelberg str. N19871]EYI39933.1 hypothetical protein SEEH1576_07278 [Salmonella enterica subsp. enterica serovar Heidelberg str. 41576]EYI43235.1 hypothetical protein SEEH9341_19